MTLSPIQSAVFSLSSLPLANMLSAELGNEDDYASSPSLCRLLLVSWVPVSLPLGSPSIPQLLTVLWDEWRSHTTSMWVVQSCSNCISVGASALIPHSLIGGLAAPFAAPSFRVWLRASVSHLSLPIQSCSFFISLHSINECIHCLSLDVVLRQLNKGLIGQLFNGCY
jgi:hypothetical protein